MYPIAILLAPDVIDVPALYPKAVLLFPVVLNSAPCHIAVLNQPVIILARALLPMAVLDTHAVLSSNAETPRAVVETCVPLPPRPNIILLIEIFPFWRIRARSIALVLNMRSCALVEPRKSVQRILFPVLLHSVALAGTVLQLAKPVASDVNTFPIPGVHPEIFI